MSGTRSVLIVEDNDRTAELLSLLFVTEGYEPERLADGAAALARLEGDPPALVVLDVMMPWASGIDVLQAMRSHPGWADTPVIITSARGDDQEIWEGWRAGADYYLVKPYKVDDLWAAAEQLLLTGEVGVL